jgi:hypothetical protein
LTIFYGCSGDGDTPDVPEGYSVEVGENYNMPSSGKISSQYSDSPAGSDVSKIVDNDRNSAVVTSHSAFYIVWAGSVSAAINSYAISSGNAPAENDPKSWKLLGSRDNQNWITLDEQTDQVFDERQEMNRYTITNTTRFTYYKLEVLSNNGGTSTHIAEWVLREPDEDMDIADLIAAYSTGSSYTELTPMGVHFANRQRTTDEIREWLLNPANEPAVPKELTTCSLQPFNVTLYPFGTPKPADANQHSIGDCGGVAALAAMAYQNPEFVKSLIVDNGDKTYTVSMYDPQGYPVQVRVSNKFVAGPSMDLRAASGKGPIATWSTVLEKAIMKYNTKYLVNPNIGGIGAEHTTPLFTGNGNSFAFKPKALTNEELVRVVRVSLLQGKFVLGGFSKGGIPLDGGGNTVTAHVFTAMHSLKDNAMFSMRNPWGGNQKVADGNDGVMNIFSDTEVPQLIDLRIIFPGRSGEDGVTQPYTPPVGS